MRCDNCPLCPIAEDDVCLESEGKYGIEHADGMLGCKHPRNWAEKRSNAAKIRAFRLLQPPDVSR